MEVEVTARRLTILIEQYVEARKKRHDVVSVSHARRAITTVLPQCPVSGKALDDLIAAAALAHGLGVAFDYQEGRGPVARQPGASRQTSVDESIPVMEDR